MIVGVDPGTTVGIAILNFNGEVVFLKSQKELGLDKVITEISKVGKPYVIATDKSTPPEFVRKLAANFGAVLFYPDEDISIEFKKEIAREFKLKDDHQRDALASAIFAYKKLRPRIIKIKKEIRDKEDSIIGAKLIGQYKEEIDRKTSESDEVRRLKKEVEKTKRTLKELRKKLKARQKVIAKKEVIPEKAELDMLRNEVKKLKKRISDMEAKEKMIERLLADAVRGSVDIFYKKVPPEYIVILKIGDTYFAKEKTKHKSIDENKLEQILEEYRKTKWKSELGNS